MSNMLSPIDFRHMDYPEVFEDEVNRLADLIARSRHFDKLSVEVLKNSAYWNSDNFQDKFRDFFSHFNIISPISENDVSLFCKRLSGCFTYAENYEVMGKIRGLLAEKIVECAFHRSLAKHKFSYLETGCAVLLYEEEMRYVCNKTNAKKERCTSDNISCEQDCKGEKRTVDIGTRIIFPNSNAKGLKFEFLFAEIKVLPKGFHYLDWAYLKQLDVALKQTNFSNTIFLVTFGSKKLMDIRIQSYNDHTFSVRLLGVDEIEKMLYENEEQNEEL